MAHSKEYEQAILLEQATKWMDAALLYEQMLLENKTVFLLSKCGWCYSRAEQYELAIVKFDELIDMEQDNPKW